MKRSNFMYFTPYAVAILLLILIGCSLKQSSPLLLEQNSYRVLLVTPYIRFHDSGFIKKYQDRTELELYAMGRALYKIHIQDFQICLQQQCYPKILFMKNIFGDNAYADLLEDILLKRNIYNGENISYRATPQGQEIRQVIQRSDNSIVYVRTLYKMQFSDSVRKIKIELESY